MLRYKAAFTLASLALATASFAASAAVVFTNLGDTAPPPTSLGGHALTPFATAPQTAIGEYTMVSVIPGNPFSGELSTAPAVQKFTATYSWGTDAWPGGYVGPIYFSGSGQNSETFTLPAGTRAFYFYAQGNGGGSGFDTYTVTTNSGTTSGPLTVQTGFWGSHVGANGFAFHSTSGEAITSITVQTDNPSGFAVGNFGISAAIPTCASEGYTSNKLTLCRQVCERNYTGAKLNALITMWARLYREDPPCAR